MSFGKRRDAHDLNDLPLDLQGDMVCLVGLVGLWMIHVDLRGGQRYFNQKLQILKHKIIKNAQKFERRPLIHGLLRAVQDTPFPSPLPPDQVCDYARKIFDVASHRCDPRDIGALQLVLIDISEAILRAELPVFGSSMDPFFVHTTPFSERMRRWVRKMSWVSDSLDRPDRLSLEAQEAMQALVVSLGAQDLWHQTV